jgi:uncharacterized protein (DUF1778 family)
MRNPNPEKESISIRVSPDFKKLVIERAQKRESSISEYFRSLVFADAEKDRANG